MFPAASTRLTSTRSGWISRVSTSYCQVKVLTGTDRYFLSAYSAEALSEIMSPSCSSFARQKTKSNEPDGADTRDVFGFLLSRTDEICSDRELR